MNNEPEQSPGFSIVLVNYKTFAITKMCLELLRPYVKATGVAVWVVDNDSADQSIEYLRTLDWVHLIERDAPHGEAGHLAHGRALDLALDRVTTDHLFLLHTDTFVFDTDVFAMLMDKSIARAGVVAVGCTEQIDRGAVRTFWRFTSRLFKHHFRRLKQTLGLPTREPKPYREVYLKSFCTLWNSKLIKRHGLKFSMDDRVPGYTLQDRMVELGYTIECLAPRKLFRYLDHIQAGTVAAAGGYGQMHRRTKMYTDMLQKFRVNE